MNLYRYIKTPRTILALANAYTKTKHCPRDSSSTKFNYFSTFLLFTADRLRSFNVLALTDHWNPVEANVSALCTFRESAVPYNANGTMIYCDSPVVGRWETKGLDFMCL